MAERDPKAEPESSSEPGEIARLRAELAEVTAKLAESEVARLAQLRTHIAEHFEVVQENRQLKADQAALSMRSRSVHLELESALAAQTRELASCKERQVDADRRAISSIARLSSLEVLLANRAPSA